MHKSIFISPTFLLVSFFFSAQVHAVEPSNLKQFDQAPLGSPLMIDLPTETFVEVDAPAKFAGTWKCSSHNNYVGAESAANSFRSIKMTIGASENSGGRIIQKWPQPSVTKTKTDDGGELIVIEYRDRPQNQSFFRTWTGEREYLKVDKWGSLSNKERVRLQGRDNVDQDKFLSTIKVLDEFAYQQRGQETMVFKPVPAK